MPIFTQGNVPWNSADDNMRMPTAGELQSGYPCGEADQQLFNFTTAYAWGQVDNTIVRAGLATSRSDLTRLAKAIAAGGLNFATIASTNGTAYTGSVPIAPLDSGWPVGMTIVVLPDRNSSGAVNLTLNGRTASVRDAGGNALPSGALVNARPAILVWDGTRWIHATFNTAASPTPAPPSTTLIAVTSTQTLTKPTWATKAWVRIVAAGGGGGGCHGSNIRETVSGAGGGAGEYREGIVAVPTATVAVTIGQGGQGGVGANPGGNGGDSAFGSLIIAKGGRGAEKTASDVTAGGAGGTGGTGGQFAAPGGYGSDGQCVGFLFPGNGGASFFGGGVRAGVGTSVPPAQTDAGAPGSGGGGTYDPSFTGTVRRATHGKHGLALVQWLDD